MEATVVVSPFDRTTPLILAPSFDVDQLNFTQRRKLNRLIVPRVLTLARLLRDERTRFSVESLIGIIRKMIAARLFPNVTLTNVGLVHRHLSIAKADLFST